MPQKIQVPSTNDSEQPVLESYEVPDINNIKFDEDDEQSDTKTPGDSEGRGEPSDDEETASPSEDGDDKEGEDGGSEEDGEEQESEGDEGEEKSEKSEDESDEDEKEPALKRDYSEFDPQDQAILRKLNNKNFNAYKERLKEFYKIREEKQKLEGRVKEVESGALPASYFEHPSGFLLSPEYTALSNSYNQVSTIASHWEQQLANIKSDQPWHALTTDKDGNPILGQEYAASPQAEAQVLAQMQKAQAALSNIQSKAESVQKEFGSRHKKATEYIRNVATEYVKKLPEEIKPSDEDVEALRKLLPEEYKGHVLTQLAGTIFGIARKQDDIINSLRNKAKKKVKLAEDQRKAGPKPTKARVPAKDEDEELDFAAIDKQIRNFKTGF